MKPDTVPVKVGDAKLAFKLRAVCVAEETGAVRIPVTVKFPLTARSAESVALLVLVFHSRLNWSSQLSVIMLPSSSHRCILNFASVVATSRCLLPRLVQIFPFSTVTSVLCFAFSAVSIAEETGLSASAVLSTLVKPTIALEIQVTVPVKAGLAKEAFESTAT